MLTFGGGCLWHLTEDRLMFNHPDFRPDMALLAVGQKS